MSSQSTADGAMTLTVTFALGTDLDNAQVQVQNRVAQALPRLPQEVQRIGVTTEKASPDFLMVVHLVSPDERYDMLYLSNYALPAGEGRAGAHRRRRQRAGLRRRRVQHARLARSRTGWPSRQLTATDVVRAIREQNVQVAAGVLGAPPAPSRHHLPALDQRAGPADHRRRVRRHRRPRDAGRPDHARCATSAASSSASNTLRAAQPARQPAGGGHRHLPAARDRTRSRRRRRSARRWSG